MNTFPSINEQNRPKGLFEPHTPGRLAFPPIYNKPDFDGSNFDGSNFDGPDWTPDFSYRIDIEADSIQLALNTLGMTKAEYNSISIQDLKTQKRIDTMGNSICALNILIYYKQNSKSFLSPFSPIQYNNNKSNLYEYKIPNVKIFPEINKFDDIV